MAIDDLLEIASSEDNDGLLARSTVLVADGHALFRRGFELLFAVMFPQTRLIGANDCNHAYTILESRTDISLAIIDLLMPGMNGMHGVRRFVQYQPNIPVILLSGHSQPEEILECINIGARAFIPKTVDETVLKHAISLVMAGEVFVPSQAITRLKNSGNQYETERFQGLSVENPLRQLTPRQRDTLTLLIEGLSNKEVARQLGLLESTVKAHVKAILKKLDAQNRTQAALIANDLGWPRPLRSRST